MWGTRPRGSPRRALRACYRPCYHNSEDTTHTAKSRTAEAASFRSRIDGGPGWSWTGDLRRTTATYITSIGIPRELRMSPGVSLRPVAPENHRDISNSECLEVHDCHLVPVLFGHLLADAWAVHAAGIRIAIIRRVVNACESGRTLQPRDASAELGIPCWSIIRAGESEHNKQDGTRTFNQSENRSHTVPPRCKRRKRGPLIRVPAVPSAARRSWGYHHQSYPSSSRMDVRKTPTRCVGIRPHAIGLLPFCYRAPQPPAPTHPSNPKKPLRDGASYWLAWRRRVSAFPDRPLRVARDLVVRARAQSLLADRRMHSQCGDLPVATNTGHYPCPARLSRWQLLVCLRVGSAGCRVNVE